MKEVTYNGLGGVMSIGTKKVKVLENYMTVEYDNKEARFTTMEQCLKHVVDNDIKEYQVWNVAKTKIKVLVKEEQPKWRQVKIG